MKMMFNAFAKKLFGAGYERLPRTLLTYVIMFWGLYISGLRVEIAPFILYLTAAAFTAGVMWQALSSEDNGENMKNLFMLPFENRRFVFAYVAALGFYTLFTKTGALFAIVFALSRQSLSAILGSIFCAVNAVFMASVIFSGRIKRYAGFIWAAAVAVAIFVLWDKPWFLPAAAAHSICAFCLLAGVDAYSFYVPGKRPGKRGVHLWPSGKKSRYSGRKEADSKSGWVSGADRTPRCLVWRGFFRYMAAHKNYLANTAVMWCLAWALPLFSGKMEGLFVMPMGFALVTFNTPVCILLSAEPALERAVRFLPGQTRAFCIPYCLFIFMCNSIAEAFFLCSWAARAGGVRGLMVITAFFFALLSALLSVLLEWFYPIRGWKIESDLWHHPRKYVVPLVMLLLAGAAGTIGACFL